MKMVLMSYYVGLDDEVKELLAKHDVGTYTTVPQVEGRVSGAELRENSHVWPGNNSMLFTVVEDATANALMSEVESFNAAAHGEGIDAYLLGVDRRALAR